MLFFIYLILYYESTVSIVHGKSISSEAVDIKWIDDQTVLDLLKNSNSTLLTIIDTRGSNEFNGWKSFEKYDYNSDIHSIFNGHFKGAMNFEIEWLFNFNETLINDLFITRIGLRPVEIEDDMMSTSDNNSNETSSFISSSTSTTNFDNLFNDTYDVLVYDTKLERLEAMRDYLLNKYKINILYLYKIIDKKLLFEEIEKNNMTEIMEHEQNYDIIISPEFLYSIIFNPLPINSKSNDTSSAEKLSMSTSSIINYKLFDVSFGDENLYYMTSHIPTSVHLDTNEVEKAPLWNRKSRVELIDLLAELGIKENNTELIIFYGNPDPMAAYRFAVIFKWLGVKNVHVLNGGYKAWLRKNFPIEKKFNKRVSIEKTENYYSDINVDETVAPYIVDMDVIIDLVKNYNVYWEQYSLIDIRSWKEFTGMITGYDSINKTGRIPGSIWGKAGSTPNELEDYRNPDLTMRSSNDIRNMWSQLGIDYMNKHLIFYCGNGWRAAEVLIYAEIMGLKKISLYDGGWFEWSRFSNNTIESGMPQLTTFNNNWETSTPIGAHIHEINQTTTVASEESSNAEEKNSSTQLIFKFNFLFILNIALSFFKLRI